MNFTQGGIERKKSLSSKEAKIERLERKGSKQRRARRDQRGTRKTSSRCPEAESRVFGDKEAAICVDHCPHSCQPGGDQDIEERDQFWCSGGTKTCQ